MNKLLKCNKKVLESLCESRRYCQYSKNDLMLSVADSDFQIPEGIKEDLIARIKQGNICYTFFDDQMLEAIKKWYFYRFNLKSKINSENIVFGSGVIHLMQVAMYTLTEPGDGVIVQPPVYEPFYEIIKNSHRRQVDNKLIYDQISHKWMIDFEDLERKMANSCNKIMFLCSPHNPVGRVWTKEELSKIINLAVKHDVFIVSDEIWQDIVFKGYNHIPLFQVSPQAKDQVFVVACQAKTYNLGGAQIGYGICFNNKILNQIKLTLKSHILYSSSNFLSACSLISGYSNEKNYKWYQEYVKLIEKNYHKLKKNIESSTNIKISDAQGMYLLWLDMSQVVINSEELDEKLRNSHLLCQNGIKYGAEYWPFLRICYAVRPDVIDEIIKRFRTAFSLKL